MFIFPPLTQWTPILHYGVDDPETGPSVTYTVEMEPAAGAGCVVPVQGQAVVVSGTLIQALNQSGDNHLGDTSRHGGVRNHDKDSG